MTDSTQYKLEYRGFLKGHGGWVTTMKVGEHVIDGQSKEFLISGSRDKSLMIWDIEEKNETDEDIVSHLYLSEGYYFNPKILKRHQVSHKGTFFFAR